MSDQETRARRLIEMGFAIPQQGVHPAEAVLDANFAARFATWEDAFGEPMPPERLRGWVGGLSTETVLLHAYWVSIVLTVTGYAERLEVQRRLAERMLHPIVWTQVRRLLEGATPLRTVIFHHEQLLVAAKLAILHGSSGPADLSQDARRVVGRILLATNSMLGSANRGDRSPEALLGTTLRGLYLGASEHSGYVAARYHGLLVRAADQTEVPEPHINADCQARHGVDVEGLIALGYFVGAPFVTEPGAVPEPAAILERTRTAEQLRSKLPEKEVLALFVADRAGLSSRLDDGSPLERTSFTPIAATPFYLTEDGRVFPLNHQLMIEKLTAGTYWALHTDYLNLSVNDMKAFVGAVGTRSLEPYIDEVLAGTAVGGQVHVSAASVAPYWSSGVRSAAGRQERVEGSDSYVLDRDVLVVYEVTASGFPVTSVMSGDGHRLLRDFQGKLLEKFGQLDRVIRDLTSGELQLPNVDTDALRKVFPVMVMLHPFPNFPNAWSVFDTILQKEALFDFQGAPWVVEHPIVLSVEEIEMVEPLVKNGTMRWGELLEAFASDGVGNRGSLKNHLIRGEIQIPDNERIRSGYEAYGNRISRKLHLMGLVSDGGGGD